MLYNLLLWTFGLSFIAGVILLWQPGSIETSRWYGATALGIAVMLAVLMPDYSKEVEQVRTPTEKLVVRAGPTLDADTAQEVDKVAPGEELHVVKDTADWVGFREDPDDPTWTGYVPAEQTEPLDKYQARQARQDSIEEAREERREQQAAERRERIGTKGMAWQMCKDFVKQNLKSPSSADFPWRTEASISHDADGWDVRAHVDANNPMGAKMRVDFLCEVQKDGDTWRLKNMNMNQR